MSHCCPCYVLLFIQTGSAPAMASYLMTDLWLFARKQAGGLLWPCVCVCWCVYEKDRNMFFLNSPKKQEWTRKAQRQGVSLFILHLFFFTSPTSSRCVFMVQRAVGWLQVVVLRRGKQTEISCLYCLRKGKFTFLPFWFNKTVDGKKKKTKTLHFLLLLVFFFYLLHHSVSKWKIRFTSSTVS